MTKVIADLSISLDGFVAGPEQSLENPLGIGGMQVHEWAFKAMAWQEEHGGQGGEDNADSRHIAALRARIGAGIMGRKMYSGGSGGWEDDPNPRGWWGDDPPFHHNVYVLTHHEREPLEMEGGTTFHFVNDGIEAAHAAAREAAGERDVLVAGGANTVQQCLSAGLLDEVFLHIAPVILGSGERLLDNVGDLELEPVEAIHSPAATHIRYRVGR